MSNKPFSHLETLIRGLNLQIRSSGSHLNRVITDIHDDSREVTSGSLFIARQGSQTSGESYIQDAIDRGAQAVLCTRKPSGADEAVCWITTPEIDAGLLGTLAKRFFEDPSRHLKLVGITGTNGKTTIAYLVRQLLNDADCRCGMIGTIEIDTGTQSHPASLTTPGVIGLNRYLARMREQGCKAAVLEISSHALDQDRIAGLTFQVGVFTNLTGDHLDYHGDMSAYAQAKARLFAMLGPTAWAVLNAEDPYSSRMVEHCGASQLWCKVIEASPPQADSESACFAQVLTLDTTHSVARLAGPWGSEQLKIPLVGRHNLSNALEAVAAAHAVDATVSDTFKASLEKMSCIPGRLEAVQRDSLVPQPRVLVDYAHTHDALENVLRALRPTCCGRLIVVFGCGGDRDITKRPKMAAVACQWADQIYITSDNPRSENPQVIIEQIKAGVPGEASDKVHCITDRQQAIEQAVGRADLEDIVLIAGKGHENYQIIGSEKQPFDDCQVARQALQQRNDSPGV